MLRVKRGEYFNKNLAMQTQLSYYECINAAHANRNGATTMKNTYRVTQIMKNGRFGKTVFQVASSEKEAISTARIYGMRGKLTAELA